MSKNPVSELDGFSRHTTHSKHCGKLGTCFLQRSLYKLKKQWQDFEWVQDSVIFHENL